jgi:hemerythrin-like domain-containing protein
MAVIFVLPAATLGSADSPVVSRTAVPLDRISPPGFTAPAAGFDQPFDMLKACHERVERTLRLLQKLVLHVTDHGVDAQARSAAPDVLRYFDIAAPLHHQDEELHVFPMLLARGDPSLSGPVHRLQADHRRMGELWADLRPWLVAIAGADEQRLHLAAFSHAARAFSDIYAAHIATEEQLIYPAAEQLCADATLQAMGDEMRERRTLPAPSDR